MGKPELEKAIKAVEEYYHGLGVPNISNALEALSQEKLYPVFLEVLSQAKKSRSPSEYISLLRSRLEDEKSKISPLEIAVIYQNGGMSPDLVKERYQSPTTTPFEKGLAELYHPKAVSGLKQDQSLSF